MDTYEEPVVDPVVLYDLALNETNVAVWSWDPRRNRVFVSPGWKALVGYAADDATERSEEWFQRVAPEHRADMQRMVDACREGKRDRFEIEHLLHTVGGHPIWVLTRARALRNAAGEIVQLLGSSIDVTEDHLRRQTLLESESRFRYLADVAPIMIWMSGPDASSSWFNRRWLEFRGRSLQQEVNEGWREGIHPDDRQKRFDTYLDAFQARREFQVEYRLRDRAGQYRWVLDCGAPRFSADAFFMGYIGGCIDVHRQRMACEALKDEQHLLRELLRHNDRDRKLVAHDIHDGLIQDVFAAEMILQYVAQDPGLPSPLIAQLEQAGHSLQRAIVEARRLISELRPLVLEDDGLVSAIGYLVAELTREEGIEITYQHHGDFRQLSPVLEGNLFRIVQEALNNIHQHSRASSASVDLFCDSQQIELEIRDSGRGFDPGGDFRGHHGVSGIRERARLFGGQCQIESQPGEGTRIRVSLPVRAEIELPEV